MQFRGVDGVDVSLRHLIRPSINSPESVFYDVACGAVSSSRLAAVGCSGSFRALGLHFDGFVLSCQSRRRRGRHIVDLSMVSELGLPEFNVRNRSRGV